MSDRGFWVLGVDPGLSGALAFLSAGGRFMLWDVPTFEVVRGKKKKREVDHSGLKKIMADMSSANIAAAYVERVGAMPGQGVTSMFTFGLAYGALLQCIASEGIPLNHVTPQQWRKGMSVRKGKGASRMRASELLPAEAHFFSRVKDNDRAEAALIALYAMEQQRPRRRRLSKGVR